MLIPACEPCRAVADLLCSLANDLGLSRLTLACVQADISAGTMINGVEGVDADRRERLIQLLDIDLDWRLNKVSDGQRRRVQICMGLLKPYQVCLHLPVEPLSNLLHLRARILLGFSAAPATTALAISHRAGQLRCRCCC